MSKLEDRARGRRRIAAKAPKIFKLDLACGRHKTEGHIGVDIIKHDGVDVQHDLTQYPWLWKKNSISEIVCNYYLSFLDGPARLKFMDECWRILVPGGKLAIKVPHWSSMRAVADPLYKWPPICETSFLVFNREWRIKNEQDHYPLTCDFDFGYGFVIAADISQRNDEFKQFAVRAYNNVVLDLTITMTKRPSPEG